MAGGGSRGPAIDTRFPRPRVAAEGGDSGSRWLQPGRASPVFVPAAIAPGTPGDLPGAAVSRRQIVRKTRPAAGLASGILPLFPGIGCLICTSAASRAADPPFIQGRLPGKFLPVKSLRPIRKVDYMDKGPQNRSNPSDHQNNW